jgi:biotin carboxyl carrier protein
VAIVELQGQFGVAIAGRLLQGQLDSEGRKSDTGAGGGDSDLVAQFPGKVRKILVADGARVNEGDSLLLVEAMKMEFAVKAGAAGIVKKVLVKEGQQLSPGDRFLDFEESKA